MKITLYQVKQTHIDAISQQCKILNTENLKNMDIMLTATEEPLIIQTKYGERMRDVIEKHNAKLGDTISIGETETPIVPSIWTVFNQWAQEIPQNYEVRGDITLFFVALENSS
jgi:hypothetical protein